MGAFPCCGMSNDPAAIEGSAVGIKKIACWNVNGIRAVVKKEGSLPDLFAKMGADIYCLQESKITASEMEDQYRFVPGYESFWSFSKTKKGYSGVVTYCRDGYTIDAKEGIDGFDEQEGRVIMTNHQHFLILNVYFPNGGREGRVEFKLEFYAAFSKYVTSLQEKHPHKNIIILGDVNTAHQMIDIHQTKEPKDTTGFLPAERKWIDKLLSQGFVDSFRHFHPDTPHCYSWWNTRTYARSKNKGWRIDYIFVPTHSVPVQKERIPTAEIESEFSSESDRNENSQSITESCSEIETQAPIPSGDDQSTAEWKMKISEATIMSDQHGSDHCPITITFQTPMPPLPEHPVAALSSNRIKQKKMKSSLLNFFGRKPPAAAPATKKQKLQPKESSSTDS